MAPKQLELVKKYINTNKQIFFRTITEEYFNSFKNTYQYRKRTACGLPSQKQTNETESNNHPWIRIEMIMISHKYTISFEEKQRIQSRTRGTQINTLRYTFIGNKATITVQEEDTDEGHCLRL